MNTHVNGPIDEAIRVLQEVAEDSRGGEGLADQMLARRANAAALRLISMRAAIAQHDFELDNIRIEAPTGEDYNAVLGILQADAWSEMWAKDSTADLKPPLGSMYRFRTISVEVAGERAAESRYTAVLILNGTDIVLQVSIRRNCYDFQSSARVDSFHRQSQEWRPVIRMDYASMKTPLVSPSGDVTEAMFDLDRDELLRRALLVLGL